MCSLEVLPELVPTNCGACFTAASMYTKRHSFATNIHILRNKSTLSMATDPHRDILN
jgi:hypothetical protein